jgi:hypothetical protein
MCSATYFYDYFRAKLPQMRYIHGVPDVESDLSPNEAPAFELEAGLIVEALRAALADVIARFRPPVRRASQLRERVNLSQKVCWGIFTAASAPDGRSIASLLPGRRGMELFFAAALAEGVAADSVESARLAFERFEEAVERHAGSGGRDAFETMAGEIGESRDPNNADLKHKRAVFRGMSLLLGRQAKMFCGTYIACPGRDGMLDLAFIKGMSGLHRTRRGVPLHTTAHLWHTAHPGDPAEVSPFVPLDPREAGPDSMALLRDFCSRPLPEFRLIESRAGYRGYELISNALGSSGEVTYFTGQAIRGACPVPGTVAGSELMMSKLVDIPLESFVGDLLMHKSVWDTRPPEVQMFACRLDGSPEFRDADRLPLSEQAEYLGEGLYAARTPLIPQYEDMLSYAMDRLGWDASEFRVFRCCVRFPLLYSRIRLTLR